MNIARPANNGPVGPENGNNNNNNNGAEGDAPPRDLNRSTSSYRRVMQRALKTWDTLVNMKPENWKIAKTAVWFVGSAVVIQRWGHLGDLATEFT